MPRLLQTAQVMKQQILDMERELTKSVKDQSDNLAVIEDQRSKLVASSSELVAARRKVGGLQTGMARWPHLSPQLIYLLGTGC